MDYVTAVKLHLDQLESTYREMKDVFEARSDDWKLRLAKLRKIQAEQLAALAGSLPEWADRILKPDERRETQRLFAGMRRSISLTQTQWPLSLINDDASLARYSVASIETIRASDKFFAWMRIKLAPERRCGHA